MQVSEGDERSTSPFQTLQPSKVMSPSNADVDHELSSPGDDRHAKADDHIRMEALVARSRAVIATRCLRWKMDVTGQNTTGTLST